MPNIIMPSKDLLDAAQSRLRMFLVIGRPDTADVLAAALAHTMPALLVSVYSSREALEVTEAVKPDAFVLEASFWDELSVVELYERLHAQPGFNKIPAILIGQLSREQHHLLAKRKAANLTYPVELCDLQSTLETLLNMPTMPVRSNTTVVFEHNSPSVA